ncbi:MAG: TonB family protein [Chloroherpetonaceae bacterium]|nr:TonB family protein [Chloroherpetonaceae bacterium]
MTLVLHLSGILLYCLTQHSPLFSQNKVLGRVTDGTGEPVSAATVSIYNSNSTLAAISNAQGYVVFLNVGDGTYTIRATKRGLPDWKQSLNVSGAITKRIEVRLTEEDVTLASATPSATTPSSKREKPAASQKPQEQKNEPKVAQSAKPTVPSVTPQTASSPSQSPASSPAANGPQLKSDEEKALADAEEALLAESGVPDTEAEVQGGIEMVQRKIVYPDVARKLKISGNVTAKVFLTKEGTVSRIEILKGTAEPLNNELIRVLTEEVDYIPAKINGNPVPSVLVVPVKFAIN